VSLAQVVIKKGREGSLRGRHPWVFSGALSRVPEGLKDGAAVEVLAHDGDCLGVGHYALGKSIAVKLFAFERVEPDFEYWRSKVERAIAYRARLNLGPAGVTDSYRLIHGEGDLLPGLIVDRYGSNFVVQFHSLGMHLIQEQIVAALSASFGNSVQSIYNKSKDTLLDTKQFDTKQFETGQLSTEGYLYGKAETGSGTLISENGIRFFVDWEKGQKTGFFLDQRDNRLLLRSIVQGKHVLNTFCYSGGFTLAALEGGAASVDSVDSSAAAISLLERNILEYGKNDRHVGFCEDSFRYLERTEKDYDLIILDPPAFAKHRQDLKNALRGYQRLNTLALKKLGRGGRLMTYSCSQLVSHDDFRFTLALAGAQAGRNIRIITELNQAACHPVNLAHPEGRYLKGLLLEVD